MARRGRRRAWGHKSDGTLPPVVAELGGHEATAPAGGALRHHEPGLDGLRALGVGVVLAYHGEVPGSAKGGFLGISLFFTLSGFLITSILLTNPRAIGRHRPCGHSGGAVTGGSFPRRT